MQAGSDLDVTYEVDVTGVEWASAATESLRENGFCVLRSTTLEVDLCKLLKHSVQDRLARLLAVAKASGHDPANPRDSFQFREVCKRMHPKRFDVRLPVARHEVFEGAAKFPEADAIAWARLHAEARRWAWPVLKDLVGGGEDIEDGQALIDLAGCVVSLSGSEPQQFHRDGKYGQYNVFVPLVTVTAENGPTEFYPQSHRVDEYDLFFNKPKLVAPCLGMRDILIFDYRVRHRGLGNSTDAVRPVAYMVYARRGVHDSINFSNTSLFDEKVDLDRLVPDFDYLGLAETDADVKALSISDDLEPSHSTNISNTFAEALSDNMDDDGLAIPMCDMDSDIFGDVESDIQEQNVDAGPFAACSMADEDSWWGQLRFSNVTQKCLGVKDDSCDSEGRSGREYCIVEGACFIAAQPVPILNPSLVCLSSAAVALIGGCEKDGLTAAQLSGNELPLGASPAAHVYCGFQFGEFAGQLGDGAALLLGELSMPAGDVLELNLKGTGQNQLTRWWNAGATGRKSLGAMVREFLMAEALAALGIPTTRALSVVQGKPSEYNTEEPCAVLLRAAATFLRFGSFEVTLPLDQHKRSAPSPADWQLLRRLADHCIGRHFPEVAAVPNCLDEEDADLAAAPRYRAFVFEVTRRTANLAAAWQCLGVVHGMLNTDNFSVIGLTLDHGSFAFMDATDGNFVGRPSDSSNRYCFKKQPEAARWACQRLSEALLALHCTDAAEMVSEVASYFDKEFQSAYQDGMRRKLGLKAAAPDLVAELVLLMEVSGADWTYTFNALSTANSRTETVNDICRYCAEGGMHEKWEVWLDGYNQLVSEEMALWDGEPVERHQAMCSINPKVVPRRWLLKRAEDAALAGNYAEVHQVFDIVTNPFEVPRNPANSLPLPPIAKINPEMLGPMGTQAVALLEDVEFWRHLCPNLHVASIDSAKAVLPSNFTLNDDRAALLRKAMECDGVFMSSSRETLLASQLAALAQGIEELHAAGWPPAFIWMYDEAWIVLARVTPLLRQVLGMDLNFDLFAERVLPGESWMPPHRDKPFVMERCQHSSGSFRSDGMPMHSTCWIPLVDVPQTSSCLMCVPKALDEGYFKTTDTSPIAGLHQLDKVRSLSMDAGSACVFSHRSYHWGKIADSVSTNGSKRQSCTFLTLAVADKAFEAPRLPRQVLPLPPLQLRVALAAGQGLLRNKASSPYDNSRELLWQCFLACANNFSADFARSVFEASASGP